jgi:surface antigen
MHHYTSDHNDGGGGNFRIAYEVEANRPYYVMVRGDPGEYSLHIDGPESSYSAQEVRVGNLVTTPDDVDLNLSAYRDDNPLWHHGFAPREFYSDPDKSRLGSAKGNCVWYANGRLRQLAYSSTALNVLVGYANTWDDIATKHNISYDNVPRVGDIAQKDNFGSTGHVAVVEAVNGDEVFISESSYCPGCAGWDFLYRTRVVNKREFERYIHVPRN